MALYRLSPSLIPHLLSVLLIPLLSSCSAIDTGRRDTFYLTAEEHLALGDIYRAKGSYDDAIREYTLAQSAPFATPASYGGCGGDCQDKAGKARGDGESSGKGPESILARAHFSIGNTYLSLSRYEAAAREYELAIGKEVDEGKRAYYYNNLAWAYIGQSGFGGGGDDGEGPLTDREEVLLKMAEEAASKGLALSTSLASSPAATNNERYIYLDTLGTVAEARGDLIGAEGYYLEALELVPAAGEGGGVSTGRVTILKNLMRVHLKLGKGKGQVPRGSGHQDSGPEDGGPEGND